MAECELFPGLFGVFVQSLLFFASISVLICKKKREDRTGPENFRTWPIFFMDSSKQLMGAGWLHLCNMGFATVLASGNNGDPCTWYFINIVLDTTLGVLVNWLLLRYVLIDLMECVTKGRGYFISGDYKDTAGNCVPAKYFAQLVLWLICVTLMKAFMVLFMAVFRGSLVELAEDFLGIWPDMCQSSHMRLLIVMVITPGIMNALQFWAQDTFLKYQVRRRARHLEACPLARGVGGSGGGTSGGEGGGGEDFDPELGVATFAESEAPGQSTFHQSPIHTFGTGGGVSMQGHREEHVQPASLSEHSLEVQNGCCMRSSHSGTSNSCSCPEDERGVASGISCSSSASRSSASRSSYVARVLRQGAGYPAAPGAMPLLSATQSQPHRDAAPSSNPQSREQSFTTSTAPGTSDSIASKSAASTAPEDAAVVAAAASSPSASGV